jgi:hypothetical protein
MGRDVDKPVVTGAASVGAVTASSGDPVRPGPVRSETDLFEVLARHGLLDPIDLEWRLTEALEDR